MSNKSYGDYIQYILQKWNPCKYETSECFSHFSLIMQSNLCAHTPAIWRTFKMDGAFMCLFPIIVLILERMESLDLKF